MMRQPARFELPPQAATARRLPKPMLPTMLPATTLPRLTALSLPQRRLAADAFRRGVRAATAARSSRSRLGVGRCRLGDWFWRWRKLSGSSGAGLELPARPDWNGGWFGDRFCLGHNRLRRRRASSS